jgi:hypothetical protein
MDFLNPFLTYFPNFSGTNLNSEFRFYNYTPNIGSLNSSTGLDNSQIEELQTAKTNAKIKGDFSTLRILETVLRFGIPSLLALSQAGVIKNKNITSLAQLQADPNALNSLLAQTGGNLDPERLSNIIQPVRSTQTSIAGIPITYIVLAFVAFIIYMLFKEPTPKTNK